MASPLQRDHSVRRDKQSVRNQSRLINKQTDKFDQLGVSDQEEGVDAKVEELEKDLQQAQLDHAKVLRQLGEVITQRDKALKNVEAAKKKKGGSANRSHDPVAVNNYSALEEENRRLDDENAQLRELADTRGREMIQVRKTYAVMNAQFGVRRDWYEQRIMDHEKHWEHKTTTLQKEHKEMSRQVDKFLEFKACQKDRYRVWMAEREELLEEIRGLKDEIATNDMGDLKLRLAEAVKEAKEARKNGAKFKEFAESALKYGSKKMRAKWEKGKI